MIKGRSMLDEITDPLQISVQTLTVSSKGTKQKQAKTKIMTAPGKSWATRCHPVNIVVTSTLVALDSFYWTGTVLDLVISSSHADIIGLSPEAFGVGVAIGVLAGICFAYCKYKVNDKYDPNKQESQSRNEDKKLVAWQYTMIVSAWYAAAIKFAAVDFVFLVWHIHMSNHLEIAVHMLFCFLVFFAPMQR
jgi:hypothetical protein